MKTFSEYRAEQQELAAERERRNRDRLKALNDMVDALDGRPDLAVYRPGDSTNVTNYSRVRDETRATVRSGEVAALEIACDHCGTELFILEPGMLLLSNPPKKRIGCPGCGWLGTIRA